MSPLLLVCEGNVLSYIQQAYETERERERGLIFWKHWLDTFTAEWRGESEGVGGSWEVTRERQMRGRKRNKNEGGYRLRGFLQLVLKGKPLWLPLEPFIEVPPGTLPVDGICWILHFNHTFIVLFYWCIDAIFLKIRRCLNTSGTYCIVYRGLASF